MKNFKRGTTIVVLAIFSVIALAYAFTASAEDCTMGYFDDCARRCEKYSVELKRDTAAGSEKCPFKSYKVHPDYLACGTYWEYSWCDPLSGMPYCGIWLCLSDYDAISNDCNFVSG